MKNKKILSAIISSAIALSAFGAAIAGCGGNKEEHVVNKWTTSVGREPTCVHNGEEKGECVDCGEIVIRDIPADPSNLALHDYGEWEVTAPTKTQEGSAVKTCSRSCTENKTYTVTLPVLTDSSYTVQTVKEESVTQEGEYVYTLKNTLGDITFSVKTDKLAITSVKDAVDVADAHAGEIRENTGHILGQIEHWKFVPEMEGRKVTAYYGNDYVHIEDKEETVDDWYSYDKDGNVLGIRTYDTGSQDEAGFGQNIVTTAIDASADNMKGFNYALSFSEIKGYGAEGFLAALYATAQDKDTVAFEESIPSKDNYAFSFAVLGTSLYVEVSVKFTLDSNGVLYKLSAEELAYEIVKYDFDTGYIYDENGEYIPEPSGHAEKPHYYGFIKCDQTLKAEGDVVPPNEYDFHYRYVSDFQAYYNGSEVTAQKATQIMAFQSTPYAITCINFEPHSASFEYDKPSLYLRVAGMPDELLNENSSVACFYNDGYIYLNSKVKGEIVIVVKTVGGCEKELKFNVVAKEPVSTQVVIDYYEYNDGSGQAVYVWRSLENNSDLTDIYTGQALTFKLGMDITDLDAVEAEPYTDLRFTAAVYKDGAPTQDATVTYVEGDQAVAIDAREGAVKIVASKPGEYVVNITSVLNTNVNKRVFVTVEEAPAYSSYFAAGTVYEGSIAFPMVAQVSVKAEEDGTLTVNVGGTQNVYLNLSVDDSARTLTTSVKDGSATKVEDGINLYDFKFKINDECKLVLIQPAYKNADTDETVYEEYILSIPEQD